MGSGTHTMTIAWDQQNGRAKPLPLSLFGEEEEKQVEGTAKVCENGVKEADEDEFGDFEFVTTDQGGNYVNGEVEVVDVVGFGSVEEAGKDDRLAADLHAFGNFEAGDVGVADGFGNFEKAGKRDDLGGDVDFQVKSSVSVSPQCVEENGWAFSTPTSQWMLAMHGIHGGTKSRKDEVSVPSYSNGDRSIPKLALPEQATDDDDWGEFAGPAIPTSTSDFIKEAERNMIDLISLTEDVPDEDTSLPSTVDSLNCNTISTGGFGGQASSAVSSVFDLLSTSDTRESCETDGGEDLFGLNFQENASSRDTVAANSADFDLLLGLEQPAEVAGTGTGGEDFFDLEFPQIFRGSDVTAKDARNLTDESLTTTVENGFVDDNWGFDVLHTKADPLSRSVSLPGTNAEGVKLASHRRSQSNGTFVPNFTLIEEWPLAPTNASLDLLFEGTDEKKSEPDLVATLLDMDGVEDKKPTSNGFIDLLDLDWENKNSVDVLEEPLADVQLGTATEANSMAPDKQPLLYLATWTELSRVCAFELEQGAQIWNEATSAQCESELVSALQGGNYFKALVHIYTVHLILRAAVHLHSSWLEVSPDQSAKLTLCMDRSREAWNGLKNALELLGLEEPVYSQTLVSQETPTCTLTLVALQSMPDVPSTVWNGNSYFLPVANLWANRISPRPPFDV